MSSQGVASGFQALLCRARISFGQLTQIERLSVSRFHDDLLPGHHRDRESLLVSSDKPLRVLVLAHPDPSSREVTGCSLICGLSGPYVLPRGGQWFPGTFVPRQDLVGQLTQIERLSVSRFHDDLLPGHHRDRKSFLVSGDKPLRVLALAHPNPSSREVAGCSLICCGLSGPYVLPRGGQWFPGTFVPRQDLVGQLTQIEGLSVSRFHDDLLPGHHRDRESLLVSSDKPLRVLVLAHPDPFGRGVAGCSLICGLSDPYVLPRGGQWFTRRFCAAPGSRLGSSLRLRGCLSVGFTTTFCPVIIVTESRYWSVVISLSASWYWRIRIPLAVRLPVAH